MAMKTELVMQALLSQRKPAPDSSRLRPGYQHTSHPTPQQNHQGCCQASRVKEPTDNAVIESFWQRSRELVCPQRFTTRAAEARAAIFWSLSRFTTAKRLHSSLNYETPETYECQVQHSPGL